MQKKAIIIGAGPAGLTAAYYLLKKTDIKPIILEESDCIGGISRTVEYKGNRIDLGGHRFFSKIDEVNKLWMELMPLQGSPALDDILLQNEKPLASGGPDPQKEDKVMLVRDRVSRIFFLRKFFDYPISLKLQTFKNMGFARTVKSGFGYLKSCIFKRNEGSLENFYINRFGEPLYEMFFKDYTTKLWGREPSQISADWGAQRVKGVSVLNVLKNAITKPFRSKNAETETSLIEQYYYPKKGPGQLWEALAEEIRALGGELHFNCCVDSLTVENGRIVGVSAGEVSFTGDYCLSSMPVRDLVKAMGDAPPEDVREVAEGLPYRDFMTVGLLCDRLKIKNDTKKRTLGNIVPDCWIYVQEADAVVGRLQIFNNWSPYMVADPEHTVWMGLEYFCNEGDKYWSMSDDEFIKLAVAELEKLDIIEHGAVRDAIRIKVKKAYPAYFDTYSRFDTVKDYLSGIDNLWCIGRNGQHRYNNMDHSMMTAIEAVNAISQGSMSKEAVWNVNTEQSYHEQKTESDESLTAEEKKGLVKNQISLILIVAAVLSVLYFIIFPSRGQYNADCYDSLLWSFASLESSKIISPDFYYAGLLPFSGQIWFVPLIAMFGMTMKAQIIGMVIFALLFFASIIFLCRSLKWSFPWTAVMLFLVTLLLSSGSKLREIMWCHVIYYSLGLLLLFVGLGLAVRMTELSSDSISRKPRRFWIPAAFFLLLSIGIATDDFQMIAISLLPIVGALVIELLTNKRDLRSNDNAGTYITLLLCAVGAFVGLKLLGLLTVNEAAPYAEAFSSFSNISEWSDNAARFLPQYFSLVNVGAHDGLALNSLEAMIGMIRLCVGILVIILPFIGLLSFGKKGDRNTRILVSVHFVTAAVIMFAFVCGTLSKANWRLIPMLGTSIAASVATLRWIWRTYGRVSRRFAAAALALMLLCGYFSSLQMITMPPKSDRDNRHYTLAAVLEAKELTYGYATFWNASTATMASDSRVKVRSVELANDTLRPYRYQTMDSWFEDQEGQDYYFVALTESEHDAISKTEYWQNLLRKCGVYEFDTGDYHVTVFDKNIF